MPLMLTTGDDLGIMTSSNFFRLYFCRYRLMELLALEDLLPEAAPELWNMYDQERWDAAK